MLPAPEKRAEGAEIHCADLSAQRGERSTPRTLDEAGRTPLGVAHLPTEAASQQPPGALPLGEQARHPLTAPTVSRNDFGRRHWSGERYELGQDLDLKLQDVMDSAKLVEETIQLYGTSYEAILKHMGLVEKNTLS